MSQLTESQPASFRGVEFRTRSKTTQEGPKVAVHEYPGTNRRFVEDLGELPPIFDLDAFVHGDDVLARRNSLRRALNFGGIGELIHPTFGAVQVSVGPFSVTETETDAGVINFRLKFFTSAPVSAPVAGKPTAALTGDQADAGIASVESYVASQFESPPSTPVSAAESQEKLEQISVSFVDAFSSVEGAVDEVAELVRDAGRLADEAAALIQSPQILAARLVAVFNSARSIAGIFRFSSLFNFGSDDDVINPTTASRIERAKNRETLNNAVRVAALIGAHESASITNFLTTDDIEDATRELDLGFVAIIQTATSGNLPADQDIRADVFALRVSTNEVMIEKEQQAYGVEPFKIPLTSAPLLTYRLYGSLDNLDTIRGLNPGQNVSRYEKTAQVIVR